MKQTVLYPTLPFKQVDGSDLLLDLCEEAYCISNTMENILAGDS
jgi:hypothetical protein